MRAGRLRPWPGWRWAWGWWWLVLAACAQPLGPDECEVRVAVLPGETVAEAVRATVPRWLIQRCGESLTLSLVFVNGQG